MSAKGLVLDIDRFSTHDGPGIRTTVFLKGCPLSCRWCHSPESQCAEQELLYQRMRCTGCGACVAACPRGAITHNGEVIEETTGVIVDREKCVRCYTCVGACLSRAMRKGGVEYSAADLVASIKPDVPFFRNSGGGVTVTGGEPLVQPDFAFEILAGCRNLGIHTILETSGYGAADDFLRLAEVSSTVYFDIKLIDSRRHEEWTGLGNDLIHKNLRNLCNLEGGKNKITVRVPCIPAVNDSVENVREIISFVSSLGIKRIQFLPYNSMAGEKYRWIGKAYTLEGTEIRDKNYYEELNGLAEAAGLAVLR